MNEQLRNYKVQCRLLFLYLKTLVVIDILVFVIQNCWHFSHDSYEKSLNVNVEAVFMHCNHPVLPKASIWCDLLFCLPYTVDHIVMFCLFFNIVDLYFSCTFQFCDQFLTSVSNGIVSLFV